MCEDTSNNNFRDDAIVELLTATDPKRRNMSYFSTSVIGDDDPLGYDDIYGCVCRYVLERLNVQAVV